MKSTEHQVNHFKVYNSVTFRAFTLLCNHLLLYLDPFSAPPEKTLCVGMSKAVMVDGKSPKIQGLRFSSEAFDQVAHI